MPICEQLSNTHTHTRTLHTLQFTSHTISDKSLNRPGNNLHKYLPPSENNKVSNYIINSKPNGCYKIGENIFDSLQKVIKFYTDSLLDTTTLKRIVVIEKVRGKYDFPGRVSLEFSVSRFSFATL